MKRRQMQRSLPPFPTQNPNRRIWRIHTLHQYLSYWSQSKQIPTPTVPPVNVLVCEPDDAGKLMAPTLVAIKLELA
jgi:hypothetical protein